ncbi:heterokaryon incompatibility protein-domain-containing protein [Cercophora newfieldiana]|uniref:Heterokaryon incompatibility protein-domain-containing protein n=1 Tax=Cercophora newfieldiana TaxID=92897 RepID=A0AA39Y808_9PEZI|nr:heterokaryon incompatibility protein-domain-containing protein [Cercophora newfieldiana]
MRLLHAETKKLFEFYGYVPKYAILSHTWGTDELTYRDIVATSGQFPANKKIDGCCRQALADELEYVWIDTICIDKSSSAELSEAINSMFAWYRDAAICYAYLSDVDSDSSTSTAELQRPESDFCCSKWFTRGWTLQELVAPGIVVFFNMNWQVIARKSFKGGGDFHRLLESITKVPDLVLGDSWRLSEISVAARMSWAARRQTTRREDRAYCLMGIFDINMTMLYGEGDRAFVRLQEEIIRTSDDESIFAWGFCGNPSESLVSIAAAAHRVPNVITIRCQVRGRLMATSPADFEGCENVELLSRSRGGHSTHYSLTNKGLLIKRPLLVLPAPFNSVLVPLNCFPLASPTQIFALPLRGTPSEDTQLWFGRSSLPILVDASFFAQRRSEETRLYIPTSPSEVFTIDNIINYIHGRIQWPLLSQTSFRITEVHPPSLIVLRGGADGEFYVWSGDDSGQARTLHGILRVACPNGKDYAVHFVHVLKETDQGEEEWTCRVGVTDLEQGSSLVPHMFSIAAAGLSSTDFGVMWPTLSSDGYLRLEFDEVLEIYCGYQE